MGDSSKIKVYVTSVSSSSEIKGRQQRIRMILEGKKVDFETVDISADPNLLSEMREITGDPKSIPPQIAKGSEYLGDYDSFNNAVEEEELEKFLKL